MLLTCSVYLGPQTLVCIKTELGLKMIIYCKPSLRLTHKYVSIIGAISSNSTFMLFIFSFEALV